MLPIATGRGEPVYPRTHDSQRPANAVFGSVVVFAVMIATGAAQTPEAAVGSPVLVLSARYAQLDQRDIRLRSALPFTS